MAWLAFSTQIARVNFSVNDGRWATVLHCVHCILEIQRPLRGAWDMGKFGGGQAGRENDEDNEHTVNVEVCNRTITSKLFWGYSIMLDLVAWLILHLWAWAEDCECHPIPYTVDGCSRRDRRKLMQHRMKRKRCPLSTRKAPYCAAGRIREILSEFLNVTQQALLVALLSWELCCMTERG